MKNALASGGERGDGMLIVFAALLSLWNSHAIVMEPTFESAEALGYQVAGEIDFAKGSFHPPVKQIKKNIEEIGEICPRTQSWDPDISSFARLVVLAWSDQDYPKPNREFHSSSQQLLAQRRAASIARKIRRGIRGRLHLELVNMANRKPHLIQLAESEKPAKGPVNVKHFLEMAGAAPSNPLGMGLFAEYSQAEKAVIWVECRESLVRGRGPPPPTIHLAGHGAKIMEFVGHF